MVRPVVVVESPFKGEPQWIEYAREACAWAVSEGWNPIASHLLYPQFMKEGDPEERQLGMRFGHDVGHAVASAAHFFTPEGMEMTKGMKEGHWHYWGRFPCIRHYTTPCNERPFLVIRTTTLGAPLP